MPCTKVHKLLRKTLYNKKVQDLTDGANIEDADCRFKHLPSACLQPSLRELDLSNNAVQALPSEISILTGLQSLHLASNALQELPAEISQCTALIGIDMSCNKLTSLPASLAKLQLLRDLQLSNNM